LKNKTAHVLLERVTLNGERTHDDEDFCENYVNHYRWSWFIISNKRPKRRRKNYNV